MNSLFDQAMRWHESQMRRIWPDVPLHDGHIHIDLVNETTWMQAREATWMRDRSSLYWQSPPQRAGRGDDEGDPDPQWQHGHTAYRFHPDDLATVEDHAEWIAQQFIARLRHAITFPTGGVQ